MSSSKAKLVFTFKHYVTVSSVGQTLNESQKKEIKDKGMNKMLKECCGDIVAKASEAQVFPKYCDKKTKKLHIDTFLGDFLKELAATVLQNKKKLTKRPDLADAEVTSLVEEIREKLAAKADDLQKPKEAKVDAVTARLTDTKGYTGSHKGRFDDSGKGKGIAGRKHLVDDSGYVTGYTNKDTYVDGADAGNDN